MEVHEIRAIAETVLHEKGLGVSFPVPLDRLLEGEFVDLEPLDSSRRFDGRLELCFNKPTIFLNTHFCGLEHARVRFTLGHELGHFFLHRRWLRRGRAFHDTDVLKGQERASVEWEANQFASECLFPCKLTERFLSGRLISISLAEDLAGRANASLPAAAIRLASLTASTCCFFWEEDGEIRWTAPSEEWRRSKFPSKAWRGRIPAGSHLETESGGYEEREVDFLTWHPNAWQRDDPLYESAVVSAGGGRLVLVVDSASEELVE